MSAKPHGCPRCGAGHQHILMGACVEYLKLLRAADAKRWARERKALNDRITAARRKLEPLRQSAKEAAKELRRAQKHAYAESMRVKHAVEVASANHADLQRARNMLRAIARVFGEHVEIP